MCSRARMKMNIYICTSAPQTRPAPTCVTYEQHNVYTYTHAYMSYMRVHTYPRTQRPPILSNRWYVVVEFVDTCASIWF